MDIQPYSSSGLLLTLAFVNAVHSILKRIKEKYLFLSMKPFYLFYLGGHLRIRGVIWLLNSLCEECFSGFEHSASNLKGRETQLLGEPNRIAIDLRMTLLKTELLPKSCPK